MDESAQIHVASGTLEVSYSDVQGGWTGAGGIGNIEADPLFVGGPSGTWTAAATYDSAVGQTTFTGAAAGFTDDELVGEFLNPDTAQVLQSLIVANTATTITVWGDFASLGAPGTTYQVNNYRLGAGSPCIDAADNTAVPFDSADLDGDGDTSERTPLDLDGNPRFQDDPATTDSGVPDPPLYPNVVDMGAYEYFPDCNGNGVHDAEDIAAGTSLECNSNGVPDECDIASGTSQDGNGNGVPDECDPGACCEANGTCSEVLEAACLTGSWVMDAVCAPNPCVQPAPTVVAVGPRYIQVTPDLGDPNTAVALYVTSPDYPCLGKYVTIQSGIGRLIDIAEPHLPSEWGVVSVADEEIIPSTDYHVQVENTFGLSDAGMDTTWQWADVDTNGTVNFSDIQLVVLGFQKIFVHATLEALDLWPCTPDGVINFADIQEAVFAFQGQTYSDRGCPLPCP